MDDVSFELQLLLGICQVAVAEFKVTLGLLSIHCSLLGNLLQLKPQLTVP